MVTQQEVIKKFMSALDAHTFKRSNFKSDKAFTTKVLDYAIKKCSSFSGVQTVIKKMLADCESYNAADPKNGWENFLLEKCGINLDNRDTGAITGSDAGGSTAKTTESIVSESSTSVNSFTGSSFLVKDLGLTIQLASFEDKYNPTEITYGDLTDNMQRYIWHALQTHWAKGALNLIAQSYGNNFGFTSSSSANVKKIYFGFYTEENGDLASTPYRYDTSSGDAFKIGIRVNMSYYGSLANGGNVDGRTTNYGNDGTDYLDRCLTHEFMHAVMDANIKFSGDLPTFIKEGVPELTIGIDNWRTSGIKKLAGNSSLLAQILIMDSDYFTVKGVSNPSYVGGYMFMRYLAKQASTQGKVIDNSSAGKKISGGNYEDILKNSASNVTISGGKSNDYISNLSGSNISINGGDGADQIYVRGRKATIDTGTGDDFVYLYSDAVNPKVVANSGNNEIQSEAQSATITTGSGNDYIELYKNASNNILNAGGGKDTIYNSGQNISINAGAGNDYIQLYSSATKTTVKAGTGNDSIKSYSSGVVYEYSSGDGKDTIVGFGAMDTLKIFDASFSSKQTGSNDVRVNVGNGSLLLKGAKSITPTIIMGVTNNSKASISISSSVKIVDATTRTKAINLTGNDLANSLVGSSKNDSIWGGKGNDSLWGGTGADKLYGDAGNDFLIGEAGNDSLRGGNGNDSLWGGDNADRLDGEEGNDSLYGNAGNDILYGGAGNDLLQGQAGNDKLFGENGNDKLYGGEGDDTLSGGKGNDSLWGGSDADTFIYSSGDGSDVIFGFDDKDTLTLKGLDFTSSYKNEVITLKFTGGGSISLKEFIADTFHINNDIYKINGSKLKKAN